MAEWNFDTFRTCEGASKHTKQGRAARAWGDNADAKEFICSMAAPCVRSGGHEESTLCGTKELLARSYLLPPHWPFGAVPLVMEFEPDACDLYSRKEVCCMITGEYHDPEAHVREALAAFLSGCHRRPRQRPCRALDLGANQGWFTAYMLQLGASVVAVEPQPDLARALNETVELNCWSRQTIVINARACSSTLPPNELRACLAPENATTCGLRTGWRLGDAESQISKLHGHRCSNMHGLPSTVSGWSLSALLKLASSIDGATPFTTPSIELIKMDGDGPVREPALAHAPS